MKHFLLISSLLLLAIASVAQKSSKAVEITIQMNDGAIHKGYITSQLVPNAMPDVVLVTTPGGKDKVKYPAQNIARILYPPTESRDSLILVNRSAMMDSARPNLTNMFYEQKYLGKGVCLYTSQTQQTFMNQTTYSTLYWACMKDKFACVGSNNNGSNNRKLLSKFFADYPDFVQKINDQQINVSASPVAAITAWDQLYGGK